MVIREGRYRRCVLVRIFGVLTGNYHTDPHNYLRKLVDFDGGFLPWEIKGNKKFHVSKLSALDLWECFLRQDP
jgi:hypothetical protein